MPQVDYWTDTQLREIPREALEREFVAALRRVLELDRGLTGNFMDSDYRWQDQTFARFLMLRGAVSPDEAARAEALVTAFAEFYPEAAIRWQEWRGDA